MLRQICSSSFRLPAMPLLSLSTIASALKLSSSLSPLNASLVPAKCFHHDPCNLRLTSRRFLSPPMMLSSRRSALMCLTASCSNGSGTESKISRESGREILIQHILVKEDDHKLLLELHKRILEGEDLSDLAVEHSICPSKEEGGMLGWVKKGEMVAEFEDAAFKAPLNKVVHCKTKFGWHLLQVLSEREESILEGITPVELHVKMQDPSFFEEAQLIDVREPDEVEFRHVEPSIALWQFGESYDTNYNMQKAIASLPGFHVLPLRQFGNWAPEITMKFDPQKDTFLLCHHGMRSLQVAKWLQMQGFRRVFNVSGGIHEYAVEVDPSVPTY